MGTESFTMKIKQITEDNIILTLPLVQRYLGVLLLICGILIPVSLFFINNNQVFLDSGSNLGTLIFNLSLGSFIGFIFIFQIPNIIYFFAMQNILTGIGHILLFILNTVAFIGTYSSIFSFLPILVSGIYLILHFKSIIVDKSTAVFTFQERILALFYSKKTIPFAEIKEIRLQYRNGLGFLTGKGVQHRYRLRLYFLEIDPGFENVSITGEEEEQSSEFFRPITLRKKLLSQSALIDSSFFNVKSYQMRKLERIIRELLRLTNFSLQEEIKKDHGIIICYRK